MQKDYAENYKKLGLKIAYFRKLKGLTQEQLAEILDVDTSFIGQIEATNIYKPITLTTLFRIADALEMAPGELLDF